MKHTIAIAVALALAGCGGASVTVNPPAPPPPVAVTPPPEAPPPPVTYPDDTDTLQALLNAGGVVQLEARTYHTSRALILMTSGTTLVGHGPSTVIELNATAPLQGCYNDRVLSSRCAESYTPPLQITADIAVGDTSFQASSVDAARTKAGDWLIITLSDPAVADARTHLGYPVTVDWVQVASVDGTTVNVTAPFRQAFSASVEPFVPNSSGLAFRVSIDTHDVTVKDLTVKADSFALGVSTYATRDWTLSGLTVDVKSDPLYVELTKGETITGNTLNGAAALNEFSESVDLTLENNVISCNTLAIGLDLGTAFFKVSGNTVLSSTHTALYALYHVHDGVIANNIIHYVQPVNGSRTLGMLIDGSPNVTISGNTLLGGGGPNSVGIYMTSNAPEAQNGAGAIPGTESDTGDVATGNTVQGFATAIVGPL